MTHSAIKTIRNWNWPYQDALSWMALAKKAHAQTGDCFVAIGSHDCDVVTLGRHAPVTQILNQQRLDERQIPVYRVDRGGGSTVHGPGQIVLYPIVSLPSLGLNVPQFTERLEQSIVHVLLEVGVRAHRILGRPGVYVQGAKIGSVGFHVAKGVVSHGLSLNVNNDLSVFDLIAACGQNTPVTSVQHQIKRICPLSALGERLLEQVMRELGLKASAAVRSSPFLADSLDERAFQ